MLDAETKRRIDTARDILVGKVPDPKSQVEQITIALIYKFMDDLDSESEELGGERQFFADGFARYGWSKLMHPGMGGHETLNLYAEAITRMPENPGIPPLFRDIFNNAYLPYRDPETLRAFLKIINEFSYDHSERLGDAFEYLLSVLGSQGDAGQFRTPRHIIDFIVAVVDPKKDDVVLDPACGTAGFLISSYKHILAANTDNGGNSTLTPDERGRLADNFKGYDISPDMVRLSLVNMYLHGFVAPQISEYDTLTSDETVERVRRRDPGESSVHVTERRDQAAQPLLGQVQAQRGPVRRLHGRAPHPHWPRRDHRAGGDHLPEPEGPHSVAQNASRGIPGRRRLAACRRLQPLLRCQDFNLDTGQGPGKRTDPNRLLQGGSGRLRSRRAGRRPVDRNDLPQVQADLPRLLNRLRAGESVDDFAPESWG